MRIRLLGFLLLLTVACGRKTQTNEASPSGNGTRFKTQVLKVYSAQDGAAAFHAYVVKWNGKEVVASDMFGTTSYKVGDSIDVMVVRQDFAPRGEPVHMFHFVVFAPFPSGKKIVSLSGLWDQANSKTPSKIPSYIDCRPDAVVLYPGAKRVTWDELRQPGNEVEHLLDRVQVHKDTEYVVVMVRPQSVKSYRTLRTLISKRPIDASYDVVDADFKVEWDEANKALAVAEGEPEAPKAAPLRVPETPAPSTTETQVFVRTPRVALSNKQPVYFECRGNELFYVDKEGLDAQVAKLLTTLKPNVRGGDIQQFLKAIQGQEVCSDYYKVNPSYLLAAVMALEPRPGAHGELPESLDQPNAKFQTILHQLDSKARYIAFLVRDDSFDAFRRARKAAFKSGFETGWELLGADEPIKFGQGGAEIRKP